MKKGKVEKKQRNATWGKKATKKEGNKKIPAFTACHNRQIKSTGVNLRQRPRGPGKPRKNHTLPNERKKKIVPDWGGEKSCSDGVEAQKDAGQEYFGGF